MPSLSFGEREPNAHYQVRPSAYVVVVGGQHQHIAVVQTPFGAFLPGGGMEQGETPLAAAVREAREECGLQLGVSGPIGMADQYVFASAEGTHFLKRSSFFQATHAGWSADSEASHQLSWLPWSVAAASLTHGSHRWAVLRCFDSSSPRAFARLLGSTTTPVARRIEPDDPVMLRASFARTVWERDESAYQRLLDEHRAGRREVWLGIIGSTPVGFASVIWESDYPPFREAGVAELSDLNVAPAHRRQGVASCIVGAAESSAALRSTPLGIGVGLHAGYGPAQRMYVRRGYVPDGRGVVHRGRVPDEGETVSLDDDLVVYFLKERGSA